MIHLTMNTGDVADCPGITPKSELDAVMPMVRNGGPIPTRAPFRVRIIYAPGCAMFTIYQGQDRITVNGLAWELMGEREIWECLERVYYAISDVCPGLMAASQALDMPGKLPWLATVLMPGMAAQPPEELRWIGAFERIYADAILKTTKYQ